MRTTKFWLLAVVGAALNVSAVAAEDGPGAKALAWIRFEDAPEQYAGKPYLWLGDRRIELAIDVQPAADHVLYLLWGAKDDVRTAKVIVNGKSQTVEGGGYDGFRWTEVALPDDLAGDDYQISIRQTGGKAAFLAEVRLIATAGTGDEAATTGSAAHKMELQAAPERSFPPLPDDPLQRSAHLAGFTISKVQRWLHEVALKRIEPDTGLYHPEGNFNYQDAWADCYPFLVWAAWLTDREALNGPVRGALHAEIKQCPQGFFTDPQNTFGGSEYVKDGLIAIVEVTGHDEWFERMKAVQDEIWANPTIETDYGQIPSTNIEVNGEQLQALARLYTMTGEQKYLGYAERLADHYLLPGDFVPTRLRDHGCEIIGGLGLLMAVESVHHPEKAETYRPHIKRMLDTILEKGTNEDGIMYDTLGRTGRLSDGWGYNYVGYLCYDMAVGKPVYRDRVERTLRSLGKAQYRNGWGRGEGGNIDEVADSVEGGLYLLNRLPIAEGLAWADHEVRANIVHADEEDHLWGTMKLQSNGVRTAIMHALMHTRGTIARPWRQGLKLGAIDTDGGIEVLLTSDTPYEGKLVFDIPRHRHYLGFQQDWPRMNTLPEWFTVEPDDTRYRVDSASDDTSRTVTGAELQRGLPVKVAPDKPLRLKVAREK